MTPLKPIANRRVRGVASERYPLNETCAHPECSEPVADPHHCFPRSQIIGDSWFVQIMDTVLVEENLPDGSKIPHGTGDIIPHVTGLCREHHEEVERHDAWIKLEEGVWNWYDRDNDIPPPPEWDLPDASNWFWKLVGSLNPQPGSKEGKPKRRKLKRDGIKRRRWTLYAPDTEEDLVGMAERVLSEVEELIGNSGDRKRSPIYTVIDAGNYVLLNEGKPE